MPCGAAARQLSLAARFVDGVAEYSQSGASLHFTHSQKHTSAAVRTAHSDFTLSVS